MLEVRVIPCLLYKGAGLYKTVKFKDPKYVGCAINAIRIFNEKEVDELIFLDINASKEGRGPDFEVVKDIASECFMPLCYGGGVKTLEDMKRLFFLGVEKVAINNYALKDPGLIKRAAEIFGSQSVIAAMDVKKNLFGKYRIYDHVKGQNTDLDPLQHALSMQDQGAGEVFINSVDRDGMLTGYDIDLLKKITGRLKVPIICSGGAAKVEHFIEAVRDGGASAVAAGSMFVFHGKHKAVLITYPEYQELEQKLGFLLQPGSK